MLTLLVFWRSGGGNVTGTGMIEDAGKMPEEKGPYVRAANMVTTRGFSDPFLNGRLSIKCSPISLSNLTFSNF